MILFKQYLSVSLLVRFVRLGFGFKPLVVWHFELDRTVCSLLFVIWLLQYYVMIAEREGNFVRVGT